MTEQAQLSAKQRPTFTRMLPGAAVSVAALAILLFLVDLEAVKEAIRLADYRFLPPAIILFLGTLAARSLAWRTILQEQISFGKAFFTENEGYLLNNVLPFRLGEIGRAFLLSRTTPLSFWEVLSTIMVERIFDVGIMAGLILSTVPLVIGADWAAQAAVATGMLVLLGFAVLYIAARNQEGALNLFIRLTAPWPRLTEFGRNKLQSFLTGLATLQDISRFGRVLFWMLVTWVLNISWYIVLLWGFVPEAKLLWGFFSVGVVSLGVAAPSTPAYIGIYEAVQVGALSVFGVEGSTALAFAVIAHSLYFIITVSFGAVGLARDGLTLGDVYRELRNRQT
jgi:hypothetical protein